MSDIVIKDTIKIENMIYEVRGKQVMLDSDLAKLYEVETKQLNRQVKRNILRFDEDFCFRLTDFEYRNLKCQIGTSNLNEHGGRRTLPYVFTEQGVAMLTSVLHSETAINQSKKIMRAFVAMRHYIGKELIEQRFINDLVIKDSKRIDLIEAALSEFKEKNNHLLF